MSIDIEWARSELASFQKLAAFRPPQSVAGVTVIGTSRRRYNVGSDAAISRSAHVVEQILDRVLPQWRTEIPDALNETVNRWCQHMEAAARVDEALLRDAEVREKLGDNAPRMGANAMHPWVWEGAKSLWQSGHYREAVGAAGRKVNAETQNKLGHRRQSETDLFKQAFTPDPPKPDSPRLRLPPNDGSKSFLSIQRGVMAFAEGCYAAIRNPISHEADLPELSEAESLEQLAAFSFLARKVSEAAVERL
ncbi:MULTISPECIES: TIGR02391 family protein [unclassified Streptomyces]|uniref:TIGR02391 family protein n=1 Tax=unclassified Streptomyces TaxID=2593676 RepID=UPI002E17BBA1|nr:MULTISPECIES: TIGR02391 family protein [unclassified Streptomyces]